MPIFKDISILNIPEEKDVEDIPEDHFKKLIVDKGKKEINRALHNLYIWNKESNPSLSQWACGMKKRLFDEKNLELEL